MFSYKRIEQDISIARRVYSIEKNAPRWFTDAQKVWIKSENEFVDFWRNCDEIYGLFENDELKIVVYIEHKQPALIEVHVSRIAHTDMKNIVRFFCSLRRQKRSEGIKVIRGWILAKNRPMLAAGRESGFVETGLKMDFGHSIRQSKRKVLRWIEVQG